MSDPVKPANESAGAPKAPDDHDFSNAIRLTGWEWILVGALALLLISFAPAAWKRVERLELEPDHRIPYELSNDYWFYDRCVKLEAARSEVLLLGDSVIWGQYVKKDQTLSHYLNEQSGREHFFANLGLDGAHPEALAGLIKHYASGIANKRVVLQCNPLWLSSPRHDLQVTEEFRFNHPRLVSQFVPWIPCYKEEISPRIAAVVEQRLPFFSWANHLQQAYFGQSAIPAWTLEHPYESPLSPLRRGLPEYTDSLRHDPIPWTERGIKKQDYAWVEPQASLQFRAFQRAIATLRSRGNQVFVLVGPFNEHLLTATNLPVYQRNKETIVHMLREQKVDCVAPAALPSKEYADASHPLAAGYARLARQLSAEAFFAK